MAGGVGKILYAGDGFIGDLVADDKLHFDQAKFEAAVEDIGNSDIDTILLPFMHVNATDQSLSFHANPIRELPDYIAPGLARVKSGFATKKRILVSICGDGHSGRINPETGKQEPNDITNAAANPQRFTLNLAEFFNNYHLDGLDFDYEGYYTPTDLANIVMLAPLIQKCVKPFALITAAPYEEPDFWFGKNGVFAQTVTVAGPLFAWFNLQFYSGGNDADAWVGDFTSWQEALAGNAQNHVSQSDATQLLYAGWNVDKSQLSDFAQAVSNIREDSNPYVNAMPGTFLWNYRYVLLSGHSLSDWTAAMDTR